MTSVIIADDHPLMLRGVSAILKSAGLEILKLCADGSEALAAIRDLHPDLAILDLIMPVLGGLDVLRSIATQGLPTRVVVLTAHEDPADLKLALDLHAAGLVMKNAGGDILLLCIRHVLAGQRWVDRTALQRIIAGAGVAPARPKPIFAPDEEAIVALVAEGQRNKEIARALSLSEATVKVRLRKIYKRLGFASRTELAVVARYRNDRTPQD